MGTGRRELWVEEPAGRRRLPDPVRTAAVRAGLIVALTLIQAVAAYLFTLAEVWSAFPLVLSSVGSTVVATWSVLDVWVTRQVWKQRYGVVSEPSSTARQLRRERRTARRAARETARIRKRPERTAGRPAAVAAGEAPAADVPRGTARSVPGRRDVDAPRQGRGELSRA